MKDRVVLPYEVLRWDHIKHCLQQLRSILLDENALVDMGVIRHKFEEVLKYARRGALQQNRKIFTAFEDWLVDQTSENQFEALRQLLPLILQHAANVDTYKNILWRIQGDKSRYTFVMSRQIMATVLACTVLDLWPSQPPHTTSVFWDELPWLHWGTLDSWTQYAKVHSIMQYFKEISLHGTTEGVVFHEKMLPESACCSLDDWVACKSVLCPIQVVLTSTHSSSHSSLQVLFIDSARNTLMESILRYPELLFCQLFFDSLSAGEALSLHGCYDVTSTTTEEARQNSHLVIIGCLPTPDKCDWVSDYLNTLWTSFYQDHHAHCEPQQGALRGPLPAPFHKQVSPITHIAEKYFASLSENILSNALKDTLESLHESSTSSSSSHSVQNGKVLVDYSQVLHLSRRRSSNLSDSSHSGSDSRRSSSASTSWKSSLSTDTTSGAEDWDNSTAAPRPSLKPCDVITEETATEESGAAGSVAVIVESDGPGNGRGTEWLAARRNASTGTRRAQWKSSAKFARSVSDGGSRSGMTPGSLEHYADRLAARIIADSLNTFRKRSGKHRVLRPTDRSSCHSELHGFIDNLVSSVFDCSQETVRLELHSGPEVVPPEVHHFLDNFVQTVLIDATGMYKQQQREEQEHLDAMWRRASEKFALDKKYFDAEFSRYWVNVPRHSKGHHLGKSQLPRRHSLPETQTCLGSGRSRRFTDFSFLRRSSEPVNKHYRFLAPLPDIRIPSEDDWCDTSSMGSSSSREMLLDWLDQRRTSGTVRSRTTSSHIEWFAQDLLLDAFNGAFQELFGDTSHHNSLVLQPHRGGPRSLHLPSPTLQSSPSSHSSHSNSHSNSRDISPRHGDSPRSRLAVVPECSADRAKKKSSGAGVGTGRSGPTPARVQREVDCVSENLSNTVLESAIGVARQPTSIIGPLPICSQHADTVLVDPLTLALLQWVAASQAHAPGFIYRTQDVALQEQLMQVCGAVSRVPVGQLVNWISDYVRISPPHANICNYLYEQLQTRPR